MVATWILVRGGSSLVAALSAFIGVGSIAFHGPMPVWGDFAHDSSILAALGYVALVELNRKSWWGLALVAAALLSIDTEIADIGQAVLAVVAVALVVRRRWRIGLLLALGGLIGRLSATGGPWCNPDSVLQGHAVWHLSAALALGLWARPE